MSRLLFITHADVAIDPDIPVPQWGLSERGRKRHQIFARNPVVSGLAQVWTSPEEKARQGGAILAQAQGIPHLERADLAEMDRSATGFLPRDEFETVADAFFANPTQSVRGWERAQDAQTRILNACRAIAAQAPGDVAIVAHGGVGALLHAHLAGAAISRRFDQNPTLCGGQYLSVDLPGWHLSHGWRDISAGEPPHEDTG